MTLKGHFGKNDDIGGTTGMMAAAGSLAESEGAGEVLGARDGDVGVEITRAAGVGEESGPGGVGGKEEVVLGGMAAAGIGLVAA
jgi:hypothetical protein